MGSEDLKKSEELLRPNLRVALCGASGSGKSTLARYIESTYNIPYQENSAGMILSERVQRLLIERYGWTRSGHADVIRLGNINPNFARDFQTELLLERVKRMQEKEEFIFDRSTVDNIVYYLLQCGHMSNEVCTKQHIDIALKALDRLTHIIMVYTPIENTQIEDNGSRIANWYYQRMVTKVFEHVLRDMVNHPRILLIKQWDWTTRCRLVDNFLTSW